MSSRNKLKINRFQSSIWLWLVFFSDMTLVELYVVVLSCNVMYARQGAHVSLKVSINFGIGTTGISMSMAFKLYEKQTINMSNSHCFCCSIDTHRT